VFLEFVDLLQRDKKEELFKQVFNRCHAAVAVSHEYEKAKAHSLWSFDERYHEQGIEILYERFSYAMAMIADRFHKDCSELYSWDAQKKTLTFVTFLSGCVDEVFKRSIRDLGFDDAVITYYEVYVDDAFDEFWDSHGALKADVIALRNSFYPEERIFLHGFSDSDKENMEDEYLRTCNRDFLHIMRIYKRWENFDVKKVLTDTKREYLPLMIKLFVSKPKEDIFADKPSAKRWQFWKS